MRTVSVKQRVSAPAGAVWSIIAAGGDMQRWCPGIETCRLEGSGAGALRFCGMQGGGLYEVIETVDHDTRLFQYRIVEQRMLPMRDILGTIHVHDRGDGTSDVLWLVNFEPTDDTPAGALAEMLSGFYAGGLHGLERFAQSGAESTPMP